MTCNIVYLSHKIKFFIFVYFNYLCYLTFSNNKLKFKLLCYTFYDCIKYI